MMSFKVAHAPTLSDINLLHTKNINKGVTAVINVMIDNQFEIMSLVN